MRESIEGPFADWRLLGLGFWQAWQIVAMCTNTVAPTEGLLFSEGNALLVLLVLMTVAYGAVVVMSRWFAPFVSRGAFYVAAAALMAAGTVAMPLVGLFCEGALGWGLFVAAAGAAALGNALLLIMWGELWSALATGRVGRHLYASYTFAFVLFFVTYAVPEPAAVGLTAAFPVASAAVLYACRREPRREPSVVPLDVRTIPVARLLVCLFVISVIWGLTQGMVVTFAEGDPLVVPKALLLAGGGIGAITLSMMVTSSPSEALTLYRPVIPAVLAGIVLLLLKPDVYPFLGTGLIIMGIYCLDMLMMLVSTDVAFRGRIPVALSFGLAVLATRAGTLAGSVGADWLIFSPLVVGPAAHRRMPHRHSPARRHRHALLHRGRCAEALRHPAHAACRRIVGAEVRGGGGHVPSDQPRVGGDRASGPRAYRSLYQRRALYRPGHREAPCEQHLPESGRVRPPGPFGRHRARRRGEVGARGGPSRSAGEGLEGEAP